MKQTNNIQDLTSKEIKDLIKKFGLSQRKLARIHRRSLAQVNDAINTREYPTLRRKITESLLRKENNKIIN